MLYSNVEIRKLASSCGFIGVGLIAIPTLITMLFYRGVDGESYSILNHFISELGEVGVSRLAPLFNTGLVAGGLFLALFMLALSLYLRNFLAYLAGAAGIASGISCSLVGVFPMNQLAMHFRVAMSFFRFGLIAVLLFTGAILLDRRKLISKWMVIPGIVTTLAFGSFLYLPDLLGMGMEVSLAVPKIRPEFWPLSFLEWTVFFTVMAWILAISVYLHRWRQGVATANLEIASRLESTSAE